MDNRNIHKSLKCLLIICGIWPKDEISTFRRYYSFYSHVTFWIFGTFTVLQCIELINITKTKDPLKISEIIILLYVNSLMKVFVFKSPGIRKLFKTTHQKEAQIITSAHEELKQIYYTFSKSAVRFSLYFIIFSYMTYSTFVITSYVQFYIMWDSSGEDSEPRKFPIMHYIFIDPVKYYNYLFTYDIIVGFLTAGFFAATNAVFVILMTYSIGQIKILQKCFQNFEQYKVKIKNEYNLSNSEASETWMKMIICEHQEVIR